MVIGAYQSPSQYLQSPVRVTRHVVVVVQLDQSYGSPVQLGTIQLLLRQDDQCKVIDQSLVTHWGWQII